MITQTGASFSAFDALSSLAAVAGCHLNAARKCFVAGTLTNPNSTKQGVASCINEQKLLRYTHSTTIFMASASSPVALVLGASRGIGRAVAHRFAASGYSLSICARVSNCHIVLYTTNWFLSHISRLVSATDCGAIQAAARHNRRVCSTDH